MTKIQKQQAEGSVWAADSEIKQNINISKHKPLSGSRYIKLSKQVHYSRKCLIIIHNKDDNKCLKWCLVRYLHPEDKNLARIRKIDKEFPRELNFKILKT